MSGTEKLRIATATSICNEFRTSFKALRKRAQNQGGNPFVLQRTLCEDYGRIFEIFLKVEKFRDIF